MAIVVGESWFVVVDGWLLIAIDGCQGLTMVHAWLLMFRSGEWLGNDKFKVIHHHYPSIANHLPLRTIKLKVI